MRRRDPIRSLYPIAIFLLALAGCGGPDFGGASRNGAFDNGLSGSYGGFGSGGYNAGGGGGAGARQTAGARGRGAYPKMEASFELSDIKGNPFDFTENDVVVTIGTPDNQTVRIPAFFDGGKTWRVRYTPEVAGRHTITKVSLNGKEVQPEKLDKKEFDANGTPQAGFVRRDTRDKTRFVLDNGNAYFPIGHNDAWGDGKTIDVAGILDKMGKAGENWSRIWMCHWDNKNLDWPQKGKVDPGALDLEVAKRWDEIVEAAQKGGIYFQMVLQHHGQYSSRVNPNWDDNPWNKKNGGFLSTPDEFFSNSRAIALTKAKYRYIIARWGYSPNILAWELFNEVQWTDAVYHKHMDEVIEWHNGMAAFLRQQDPFKHLVTTSSIMEPKDLWQNMDYYQPHSYPADPIAAVAGLASIKADKPLFYGEIGPSEGDDKDGRFLHRALWSSVMNETGGAAQYWSWENVDKNDLYGQFRAASDFARTSGMTSKRGLLPAAANVETKERGPLEFGPGGEWAAAKQTEFIVSPNGTVEGIGEMPAYFQGSAHREMFPSATFKTTYSEAGTFAVKVGKVSKAGGHLVVSVDGTAAAQKEFPAGEKDTSVDETIEVKVPAGAHDIKIENTGADWVFVRRFTLTPYAPALAVMGKAGKDYAALWVYNRAAGEKSPENGSSGKLTVAGFQAGKYKAVWWNTQTGKSLSEDMVTVTSGSPLVLTTPAITTDAAVYVTASGEKTAQKPAGKPASPKKKGS